MHLEGICGKCLVCATCHVILPDEVYAVVNPADAMEQETLEWQVRNTELKPTSRLGC